MFVKIPSIKIMRGFGKNDLKKKQFTPPSWIIFGQTDELFVNAGITNKKQKTFWKSVENWPLHS
jgi:hypothetical protein